MLRLHYGFCFVTVLFSPDFYALPNPSVNVTHVVKASTMGKDYWVTGFLCRFLLFLLFCCFLHFERSGGFNTYYLSLNIFKKCISRFFVGAYSGANVAFTPYYGTQMGMSTQLYDYGVYYASKRFNDTSTNRQVCIFQWPFGEIDFVPQSLHEFVFFFFLFFFCFFRLLHTVVTPLRILLFFLIKILSVILRATVFRFSLAGLWICLVLGIMTLTQRHGHQLSLFPDLSL